MSSHRCLIWPSGRLFLWNEDDDDDDDDDDDGSGGGGDCGGGGYQGSALGRGYIEAKTDTTQQSGQTPDKEVEIRNITVYVSGYTETPDSRGR